MSQPLLKLVETESKLALLMTELRAKAHANDQAKTDALKASLAAVVDEIELALSAEHGELEDARRLRRLAKLREDAAREHAARIGRLLRLAKRKHKLEHGQWQAWVEEQEFGGHRTATEYMRIAKRKRSIGQMNNDATQAEYKAVERAQVEEAKRMATTLERQREREAAKAALVAFTQSLRPAEPAQPLRRRW